MSTRGIALPEQAKPLFLNHAQRAAFTAGVLCWLETNIENFRPPDKDAVHAVSSNCILPGPLHKAFSELGIALRVVARTPALANRPEVQSLITAWLSMVDQQSLFFDIEERIGLFATHVALAVTAGDLRPPGSSALRERLQRVVSRGFVDRIERNAWQQLDLRYYFDAAGLEHKFPGHAELLRVSSLVDPPQLPYVRDIDLYAVTHILFDICDFGMKDPSPLLGEMKPQIDEYVGLALSMCLANQNWDLSAELLMCRLYLGFAGEFEKWAMARICDVQHSTGYIAPTAADQARLDHGAADEFMEVYHPTVVCLFLLAAEARGAQ